MTEYWQEIARELLDTYENDLFRTSDTARNEWIGKAKALISETLRASEAVHA